LGTPEAAWASFTGATTLDCAVVCIVTTVSCGATLPSWKAKKLGKLSQEKVL
jgi:hypothetical protein